MNMFGLRLGRLKSHGIHSLTCLVHLLSFLLAICPAHWHLRHFILRMMSETLVCSWIHVHVVSISFANIQYLAFHASVCDSQFLNGLRICCPFFTSVCEYWEDAPINTFMFQEYRKLVFKHNLQFTNSWPPSFCTTLNLSLNHHPFNFADRGRHNFRPRLALDLQL